MSRHRNPPVPPAAPHLSRWPATIVAAGLAALVVGVFASVRHFEFVSWDDPFYITGNPIVMRGLTWRGLVWAFTTGQSFYWHPLTWISHMIDVQLFGTDAGWHHVTSLVCHLINTLLVFAVIRQMGARLGQSAFVAALFAVHPMHVESVAWVAERKDLLSTMFALLALGSYLRFVTRGRRLSYVGATLWFALGLMSKPMIVTLPFIFLLLDVWPLRRTAAAGAAGPSPAFGGPRSWWQLCAEKVPFVALSLAVGAVTVLTQRQAGALGDLNALPVGVRLAHAAVSYVTYLVKLVWPVGLSAFYPYPRSAPPWWQVIGAAGLLVAISVATLRATSRRYLAVGWFIYLVALLPVVGLVQVGDQAMADRFSYVPFVGVFVLIAWGVPDLVARWRPARLALPVVATAIVGVSAVLAHAQVGTWQTSETLWQHALNVTGDDNFRAQLGLGEVLRQEDAEAALPHLAEAARLAPGCADCHDELGLALTATGRVSQAAAEYRAAVRLDPADGDAHDNLGAMLARNGRTTDAIAEYRIALTLAPDNAQAHQNLGLALATVGRWDEAAEECETALSIDPREATWHDQLAAILDDRGDVNGAIDQFKAALEIDPSDATAHRGLDTLTPLAKPRPR